MTLTEEFMVLTVRLPRSLVGALDQHAGRLSKDLPSGARPLTRSDVIRTFLLSGLAAAKPRR
jgi:hypothetical protein